MQTLILFSGGIDSSALIPYYKNLDSEVELLYINYGQNAYQKEWKSALRVAEFYQLQISKIELKGIQNLSDEIIGRNLFLISTAILHKQKDHGIISIGIHSGTNYKDCEPEFISICNRILIEQSLLSLKIDAPFISMQKNEIWEFANQNNVPLDLTYSCELGLNQPCNSCPSCKDLIKLYGTKD